MEMFRKLQVDANCMNRVKLIIICFEMATTEDLRTKTLAQRSRDS